MLFSFWLFGRMGDAATLGTNKLLSSGPVFFGAALRLSFFFVELIGEALHLFALRERTWQINHTFAIGFSNYSYLVA
jgi:hypothetical protein